GPDRSRLEQLDVDHQVIFTGALTGQFLAEAYASSDVFVFASRVETFGNVVLEAMASGLPVIAYDYACAHQYIKHAESGWLFDVQDEVGFCAQLMRIPDVQTLRVMGTVAVEAVQQVGWQRPVQQFEQALYHALQGCQYRAV
ncbi:MAG: glycosyltransferase, partial [Acinetobacter sp.]